MRKILPPPSEPSTQSSLPARKPFGISLAVARPVLLMTGALALIAASGSTQTTGQSGDTATRRATTMPSTNSKNGRRLYVRMGCQDCHGYEGQGATRTGPRIGPNPVPYAQFLQENRQPSGQMPPYTSRIISDRDLADIYAFLVSLPTPPDPRTIPILK